MKRYSIAIAAAVLAASPASADDEASMKLLVAAVASLPSPAATIQYGDDALRSGTVRLPTGKGPFPVAVLIHGGCWTRGYATRKSFEPLADALAKRGIAVWNIEYGQIGDPGAGWPGTFQDVAKAIDYLPALAKKYPLDQKRVTFVGHSAGAHLALWAASRAQLGSPWGNAGTIKPRSVVVIDGPGSLAPFVGMDAQVCGKPVIAPFMGGTPDDQPERYRIASPADHLPLGVRQLIVEGELGPLMKAYVAAAKASGDPTEELAPAGADHFDIIVPSTSNGSKVIDFIASRAFAR